ncbi:MAG: hypothetical protein ACFFG0_19685 [Candidatus Thorarchaeota archaeon]
MDLQNIEGKAVKNAENAILKTFTPKLAKTMRLALQEQDDDDVFDSDEEEEEEDMEEQTDHDAGKDDDHDLGTDDELEEECDDDMKKEQEEDDEEAGDEERVEEQEDDEDEEEVTLDLGDDEEEMGEQDELPDDEEEMGEQEDDEEEMGEQEDDEELELPDDEEEMGEQDELPDDDEEIEIPDELFSDEEDEVGEQEQEDDEELEEGGLYTVRDGKYSKITPTEALQTELEKVTQERNKLHGAVKFLTSQLKEVNLFNSKMAHLTMLLNTGYFSNKDKVKIAEQLDKCKTLKAVKKMYKEIVNEAKEDKQDTLNPLDSLGKVLNENRNRRRATSDKVFESPEVVRMKQLAGITDKKEE